MDTPLLDEALDIMREVLKSPVHDRGWKAILLSYIRMARFVERHSPWDDEMTAGLDQERVREGALANRDGVAHDDCPYPDEPFTEFPMMRRAWQFGWRQQEMQDRMSGSVELRPLT